MQNWVINVQGFLLRCATFGFTSNYKAIMSGSFKTEVMQLSRGNAIAYALGDIAYRYAFCSNQIIRMEISEGTMIDFLLNKFVRAALKLDTNEKMTAVEQKLITIVSDNYKQIYKIYSKDKDENEKLYLRLLLVTDFICGMTDSYAKSIYQEINGILI